MCFTVVGAQESNGNGDRDLHVKQLGQRIHLGEVFHIVPM